MPDPSPQVDSAEPGAPLSGGALRSAISQAMVKLYATHYGKGATQAKTYAFDNVVVTVLRDVVTTVERTLIDAGNDQAVRDLRAVFDGILRDAIVEAVEELTGRRVESFMSQIDPGANIASGVFVLEDGGESEG